MKQLSLHIVLIFLTCYSSFGQRSEGLNCWNFAYGRTGTPGDYLSISLEKNNLRKEAYYAQAAYEFSRYSGLRYSNFSIGLGYRYYIIGNAEPSDKKKVNVVAGAGGIAQIEWEPNLYKDLDFNDRLNYGAFGHLLVEYTFDRTLGFFICGEQKYLFSQILGKTNYNVSVGIRIHFGGEQ